MPSTNIGCKCKQEPCADKQVYARDLWSGVHGMQSELKVGQKFQSRLKFVLNMYIIALA